MKTKRILNNVLLYNTVSIKLLSIQTASLFIYIYIYISINTIYLTIYLISIIHITDMLPQHPVNIKELINLIINL